MNTIIFRNALFIINELFYITTFEFVPSNKIGIEHEFSERGGIRFINSWIIVLTVGLWCFDGEIEMIFSLSLNIHPGLSSVHYCNAIEYKIHIKYAADGTWQLWQRFKKPPSKQTRDQISKPCLNFSQNLNLFHTAYNPLIRSLDWRSM